MARIQLVQPPFLSHKAAEIETATPYFPLGLLYLAAFVRDAGHDVTVFDGTFVEDKSDYVEALRDASPDVVGISAVLPTRRDVLELAALAKSHGAIVIVGGPDPTTSPDFYLASLDVDVVVHHEGELTMVALLDLFDSGRFDVVALENEAGVAFRKGSQIAVNVPRSYIEDLDDLPMPARDLIDMDRYLQAWEDNNGYSSMTISTTRGCAYGCKWCRDAVHGHDFRQRSPESVAAEVNAISSEWNVTRLRMVDDVDAIERRWLEDWATASESARVVIPFEGLNELSRQDIPLLDVRDSL